MESNLPSETARVVIVDDHILFQELITAVVNNVPGLRVVGWAKTEAEAVQLFTRLRPHIIILDLLLVPSDSGLVALHRICAAAHGAHILVFSGNLTPAVIRRILTAGEFSLIDKSATLEEFRAALRTVAQGRIYFSPEIAESIRRLVLSSHQSGTRSTTLTRREESVLSYLARGLSSREIAAALGLSRHTVANHRNRLMRKIGVHRAAQLSLYAANNGLLTAPSGPERKSSSARGRGKQ